MHTDEVTLIRRSQQGDTTSFDLIVQRHYALVYNTAYRMLGEPDPAADATQTAFVRAYKALGSFRGECALSTWLFRIVTNVCLDICGRRAPEAAGLSLLDDCSPAGGRLVADPDGDPSQAVEQAERQALVQQALDRLEPEHRAVLVLYDLNGLSYQEMAEALELPLGTVKSRLNRARLALRKVLAPHLELFE